MSYISDHLCHFVGRSCPNDDERFDLLVKIIKEQQLKANLKNPDHPSIASDLGYKGGNLGEVFRKCDCVCFCDIPDEMLGIHTSKHSRFGLGFSKTFLSKLGVHPVMYIPSHGKIEELPQTDSPKEKTTDYFLYLSRLNATFTPILMYLNQVFPFEQQLVNAYSYCEETKHLIEQWDSSMVQRILDKEGHSILFSQVVAFATLLAYVKIFDETLPENDPDNYYMEREWRSLKSIDFTLENVEKIYLPSAVYKERFLLEFPGYSGAFWLFDEQGDTAYA